MSVVKLVNNVLLKDSLSDTSTLSLKFLYFLDLLFSLILSKITTVSLTEYPAIVNNATANKLFTSTDKIIPNHEKQPKTINKSWNKAAKARTENFLSNLIDRYNEIATNEIARDYKYKTIIN